MTPAEFRKLAIEAMAEEIYETQRQDHDGVQWALLSEKSYEKARLATINGPVVFGSEEGPLPLNPKRP